jgi:Flp pilus assembly protein CpaB
MNYRAKNIGIAVALAALAAVLTSVYVVNYKHHVQNGENKVPVLVAARDIPAGTSGADIIDRNMLKKETVPRKAVVAGSISSADQLSQYIATADVYQGEQVTTRRFAPPREQGIRAQIKGTQRAYQLEGNQHQLLAGTLKAGDHVDVIGTWCTPGDTGSEQCLAVSRDVVQNLLVLTAPAAPTTGGNAALAASQDAASVQLRATDFQTSKILWLQKNSVDSGNGWHLALRPPTGSLDSPNVLQDWHTLELPGPGRRPH